MASLQSEAEYINLNYVHVHNRKVYLTPKSLNVFPLDNKFRRSMIWLVEWTWFDRIVMLLIILNTIFLGFVDYSGDNPDHFGNKLVSFCFIISG